MVGKSGGFLRAATMRRALAQGMWAMVGVIVIGLLLSGCGSSLFASATPTPDQATVWRTVQANVPEVRDVSLFEARKVMSLLGPDVEWLDVMVQISGKRGTDAIKMQQMLHITEDEMRTRPSIVLEKMFAYLRNVSTNSNPSIAKAIAFEIMTKYLLINIDLKTADRLIELAFSSSAPSPSR
ncbi:MAG: hypothetical protein M1343_08470 [Chloroflexi bacterium]|nr:hypothetical protein [Chloroflexota bacterium]